MTCTAMYGNGARIGIIMDIMEHLQMVQPGYRLPAPPVFYGAVPGGNPQTFVVFHFADIVFLQTVAVGSVFALSAVLDSVF